MTSRPDAPSITGGEIAGFRGQRLRYGQLTGPEKREHLFEAGIRATAYAVDELPDVHGGIVQFAGAALTSIAHHLLAQTLTRTGDELETPKRKLFHTYGTTAKIAYTPAPGQPYTGLFGHRASGLARFSFAGPVAGVGIVPGLGLKFPRDGDHPSADLVVMRMLDPQSGRSVFEHVFTNILPSPRALNLVMRAVVARFETVVAEGRGLHQPLDELAAFDPSGARVAGPVRAPHRLLLVPADAARRAADPALDFRDDLARNVPAGTRIYEVRALDEAAEAAPGDGRAADLDELARRAAVIGAIATESEFVASRYGDHRLFFRHGDAFLRTELAPERASG